MIARALSFSLAVCTLAATAFAAEEGGTTAAQRAGTASSPAPAGEPQDFVFLSDSQPIFFRLHIQVDGKGFETQWLEAIRRLHKYMDTNGDGWLSAAERDRGSILERLKNPTPAMGGRRQFLSSPVGASSGARTSEVATAEDLANYLRPTFGPFQLQINAQADNSPEVLFNHLDLDGDKTLTKAELESAGASLRRFDRDDDETVQLQELQPYRNPYFGRVAQNRTVSNADDAPFAALSRSDPRTKLVRRLLAKYDRPERDNKLSRSELGFETAVFERADGDGDGGLDTDELVHYLADFTPDLVLAIRIDKQTQAKVELIQTGPAPTAMAAHARKTGEGGLDLILETVQVELNSGGSGQAQVNVRQFYKSQFAAADADNNKYLDKTEAQRNGVFDDATFKLLDRDNDGKLFETEMNDFISQEADTTESRTMLTATDGGRSLFEVLDVNRDRRLSARELRAALKKVASWDHNGDGLVSAGEVPRHFRLGFGRGQSMLLARFGFANADNGMVYAAGSSLAQAPNWFRKMDRNHDGDLSRREFLGSLNDFNRLDTDHDGLLNAEEANSAK